MARKKSTKWFIRLRGSYLPNSIAGWLTYIPYVCYLFAVLAFVVHYNYGLVESIFVLVPNWVAAAVVLQWFASNKS